ncbi:MULTISPECIES: hypothetical protein [Flavobacterium]|uniref:DUF4265 domain-containing protein n=1 Tax=Flavobacterium jumunjinense TaxID=998845 RepID=A0ABV5GPA3_9FLAO|nr:MULTISPECIES: hypothetical protein [Flavobacterium]
MNEEEIIDIKMYVPKEASTGTYEVIRISENRYKLTHNNPFSEILTYGTIIDVLPEKKDKDTFVFKRVYAESEFNLEVIGLPMSLNETEMRVVGQMIIAEGGYWEVFFGGMGYVNLPKTSQLNVIDELNKLIREK